MQLKGKHAMILGGVVLVGGILYLHNKYKKSTGVAKPSASAGTVSFNGRQYKNQDGKGNVVCAYPNTTEVCCCTPTGNIHNSYPNNGGNSCVCCCTSENCQCSGFFCDPKTNSEWYNPFSWNW